MRRGTALAAVTAIFLVGVLVGVLATHLFYLRQLRQPGGFLDLSTRLIAADLDRRLDLTSDQRRQIREVLEQSRRQAVELRRQMAPEILALADDTHERIRAVLTSEQQEKFERLRQHRRRMVEEMLQR